MKTISIKKKCQKLSVIGISLNMKGRGVGVELKRQQTIDLHFVLQCLIIQKQE